jgi:pimeloyl-ACP methyl ester carboxylesterase
MTDIAKREEEGLTAPGIGQLAVIADAGHFPWLDAAEQYGSVLTSFIARS